MHHSPAQQLVQQQLRHVVQHVVEQWVWQSGQQPPAIICPAILHLQHIVVMGISKKRKKWTIPIVSVCAPESSQCPPAHEAGVPWAMGKVGLRGGGGGSFEPPQWRGGGWERGSRDRPVPRG